MALNPNGTIGRVVQRVAGSAPFQRFAPQVIPPIDRVLHKVTSGRFIMSRLLVPSAVLETTGRKSGQRRQSPVAAFLVDGIVHVVGSNFGKSSHPAWALNLMADASVDVTWQGKRFESNAELLSGQERADAWKQLVAQWPLYQQYQREVARELPVFRLAPNSS